MKKGYAVLGAAGVLAGINAVRAAKFVPEKKSCDPLEKENVNVERYRKNLCEAIRIKTISHNNPEDTDWTQFDKFREFISYYMSYWNNRRISMANVGLPPMVKRKMYYAAHERVA